MIPSLQLSILDTALTYAASGLSVFPAYKNKRPVVKWQPFQEEIAGEAVIRRWFGKGRYNVAVVCGEVSGGLVVLDFDHDASRVFPAWAEFVKSNYVLPNLPVVQTGRGYHVYYRCQEPVNNTMLAGLPVPIPDKPGKFTRIPIIETRGEGGFALAPPSKHENGKVYTLLQGDLGQVPFLDDDQVQALFKACAFFDVVTEETSAEKPGVTNSVVTEEPGLTAPGVTNGREDAYVTAAFARETAAVRDAAKGNRNNQLFRSTAALAGLVVGGLTTEGKVRQAMLDAAGDLLQDEPGQTKRTIASGLKSGRRKARRLPPPPAPPANGTGPNPAPAKSKPKGSLNINQKNPKTKDFMTALKWLGYEFRLNELDDTIEVNGEAINDGIASIIRNRMRDVGLNSVPWLTDAYVHLAHKSTYHPIKDYFNSLKWDGRDHIGHFVDRYLTETTGFGKTAFLRWFVGAVAKVFEQAQNFMLVMDGTQDVGKSTLVRWLCPLPDYFIEGPIKPDDKDYLLRMCTKLVWEVSELQSTTRKADREALKGFITMQEVTVRKAYARYDTVKPAIVSLMGTVNEDGAGFLTDPTGNRRFVVINLKAIDFNYEELDINKLWAQAVGLYRRGERWQLSKKERAIRDSINAQYEMTSILSTYFFEYYRVDPSNKDASELTYDILNTLELAGLKGSQQANMNELSRLLRRLGAEQFRARVGGKRPTAYRGVLPLEEL